MSTAATSVEDREDFVLGKVGETLFRFERAEVVPAGTQIIFEDDLTQMTQDELEEMYGKITGLGVKHFKDPSMALENLKYQVAKMPIQDPEKLAADSTPDSLESKKTGRKYERKAPNVYTLILDKDTEKAVLTLSPQARTCVSILVDFAKETGKLSFGEEELKARFESDKDRLNTRQGPWRILQYYRSKLIGSNILRVS